MGKIAQKIEIDFTDEAITNSAGSVFLERAAARHRLRERLGPALGLKQRQRGASDEEMMMSLIFSLAQGDGSILDVDRLGADRGRQRLLGLSEVPDSRRLGEYLARFDEVAVERLRKVALVLAKEVSTEVCQAEETAKGYVPLFVDGTAIEVDGQYFEGAKRGYNGENQYWLHNVFVGRLWASQQLHPGGVGVTRGWQKQLEEIEGLFEGLKVWFRGDNAYYDGKVVKYCHSKGWDYSISVTSDGYKKPLREEVRYLSDQDWEWIGDDHTEEAAFIYHQPHGWEEVETYVVVRSWWDGAQRRIRPKHIFILVSRADLAIGELVRRHRAKQGQENAQKGPLIDLDLHHPPCWRYQANRAFYTAAQISQLLLCAVQYGLLPESARSHGIRTIIRDLIRVPGRLVRHSRRWILRFAKSSLRLDWLAFAADRLERWAAG